MKIYLASKSPRRRELLSQMGIQFELLIVETPEFMTAGESAEEYSIRVTNEKLEAASIKMKNEKLAIMPILCADTEVILDGKILGKPQDIQDAFSMLKSLSGRSHQVITSVSINYFDYQKTQINSTTVTFASMSNQDIHNYLATGDYKDKAGGYGIQSFAGQFIGRIEGCYYSVMGLPLNTVRELLVDLKMHYPNLT